MTGPGPQDPGRRSVAALWFGATDPGVVRRLATLATLAAVVPAVIGGFVAVMWWYAQVSHRATSGSRGYVEGSPFPWLPVGLLALLTVACVVVAVVQWARYGRLRRDAAGPQR
ncbi:hypothetical protein AAG589_07275 [Isoptericola sp. F-RaC21]|uniref:hypothetical protein n=1 Tax=Isoptericola sp. F-RaC21 TaxID=3141452 RepID=UPI00315B8617